MKLSLFRWAVSFLPALCLSTCTLADEPVFDPGQCGPDEIDMGDYCAQRSPDTRKLQSGSKRVTPFRIKSMMPGRVGSAPAEPEAQPPREKAESLEGRGFGVQLGVFSERQTALDVARRAAERVGEPFHLAPIRRGERILWACIHGPFPDKETAVAARNRLHGSTPYKDAFIKPLDKVELIVVDHAKTQE